MPNYGIIAIIFANIAESKTPVSKRGAYTDVYALAATLYFLVTNRLPHPAVSRASGVVLEEPISINSSISDRVNQAILRGMELEPENRPQTMQEWLELLNEAPHRNPVQNSQSLSQPLNTRSKIHSLVVSCIDYPVYLRRVLAFLIDCIILFVFVAPIGGVFTYYESDIIGSFWETYSINNVQVVSLAILILITLIWLYFVLFESSAKQATPGKMRLKIVVTDMNGKRISFWRATWRFLLTLVFLYLYLLFGLGILFDYLIPYYHKNKRPLRDILSVTLVIRK